MACQFSHFSCTQYMHILYCLSYSIRYNRENLYVLKCLGSKFIFLNKFFHNVINNVWLCDGKVWCYLIWSFHFFLLPFKLFSVAGDSYRMEHNHISNFQGVYKNLHIPAVIIGGVFALIALVLSTLLILQHLRSYNNPSVSCSTILLVACGTLFIQSLKSHLHSFEIEMSNTFFESHYRIRASSLHVPPITDIIK